LEENPFMQINKLSNEELEIWLSLARALGPTKFFSVIRACRSLDEVLKYLDGLTKNKRYIAFKMHEKRSIMQGKLEPKSYLNVIQITLTF
jgi:hypothetical protein